MHVLCKCLNDVIPPDGFPSTKRQYGEESTWRQTEKEFAIVVVNCVYTSQVCGMMKTEIASLSLFVAS